MRSVGRGGWKEDTRGNGEEKEKLVRGQGKKGYNTKGTNVG